MIAPRISQASTTARLLRIFWITPDFLLGMYGTLLSFSISPMTRLFANVCPQDIASTIDRAFNSTPISLLLILGGRVPLFQGKGENP